jgi:hypothetical protein
VCAVIVGFRSINVCVFGVFFLVFLSSELCRSSSDVVGNVSPARKMAATEEQLQPAWTRGDVLPRVVETPALDEAYPHAVSVDGSELDAADRRWPDDRFVDSKMEREVRRLVEVQMGEGQCGVTHFRGSNARMQWPGGTLYGQGIVVRESISQRVGECTNTGDDDRL